MTALKDRLLQPLTPHRDRIVGCADKPVRLVRRVNLEKVAEYV